MRAANQAPGLTGGRRPGTPHGSRRQPSGGHRTDAPIGRLPGQSGGRLRGATVFFLVLWLAVLSVYGGDMRSRSANGTVTVMASWTGDEEASFRKLLLRFTQQTGIRVDYEGTTALREVLVSAVESGTAPDVAVLPSLGELTDYAARGELAPLDGVVADARNRAAYPSFQTQEIHGHLYWVPVKEDLKSLVWYDARRHTAGQLPALAAHGAQWCAGMGAESTSGWPGTDWIEDLLLQREGPSVYDAWATGRLPWTDPRVVAAWRALGHLFAGSKVSQQVLTSHYVDVAKRMFAAHPSCAMEHGASFTRLDRPRSTTREDDFVFSSQLLPGAQHASDAHEISGDYAAMFHSTPQSRRLMAYLTSLPVLRDWAKEAWGDGIMTFLANREVPVADQSADRVTRRVAETLHSNAPQCLDASDSMPPGIRTDFQRAVLQFLSHPTQDPTPLLRQLDRVRTTEDTHDWLSRVCS